MYLQAARESVTRGSCTAVPDDGGEPPQPESPEAAPLDVAEHVRAQVDTWPALTDAQRVRLSVLLRPGR